MISNSQKMNFSVVMSIYKNDRIEYLKKAIDSVLNQTLIPNEYIIVIDGPVNNDISEYLKELSIKEDIIQFVFLKENKGLANALNVGVRKSKYDIIARMDADDICLQERFEKQIAFLKGNNLDIVGSQIAEFYEDQNKIESVRSVPVNHEDLVKFMKFRSPFSHPTIMFEKSIFDKINGYDSGVFPEDYDFFVRAYLNGAKFGNLTENLLLFRLGKNKEDSLKRRHGVNYAINEFKLYQKFYRLGFYSFFEFMKTTIFKVSLRIIPFKIFKYIYIKYAR